jgi:hypothetical protein
MDKLMLNKIENKLFYYPGFYDGILEADNYFRFNDLNQFEEVWGDIRDFLQCYNYTTLAVSPSGVCVETIYPFSNEADFVLVKNIMVSYL